MPRPATFVKEKCRSQRFVRPIITLVNGREAESAGIDGRDLLEVSAHGLACPDASFTVDPWKPVPRAVITHAHADHACTGCGEYICTPATADLLRVRIGESIKICELPFGTTRRFGEVDVSLHPAGHVLGSAQVRLQHCRGGPVWVVTGDYKRDDDPTVEPFELVPCDVFITESTFGLPIFTWPDAATVASEINAWRRTNHEQGCTSVILAYSLGKAQRVLNLLDSNLGPVGVHGSIPKINEVYTARGIALHDSIHATEESAADLRTHTIVAPPSAAASPWIRRFAGPNGIRTAMISGWMTIRGRRRWRALHRGFVISDHADWPGLLQTVKETGASRVGATHGYAAPLARYLEETLGVASFVLPTRYGDEERDAAEGDAS